MIREVLLAFILLILVYAIYKVVRILDEFLVAYNKHIDILKSTERRTFNVDTMTKPHYETPLAPTKPSIKVEDLSPDLIAPALKKPPKPPGGFGSKVNG